MPEWQDKLSFSGCSWRAGLAASDLICDGLIPPFILVGIDHAGAWRSHDYLPCPPGAGAGNVRPVRALAQRTLLRPFFSAPPPLLASRCMHLRSCALRLQLPPMRAAQPGAALCSAQP